MIDLYKTIHLQTAKPPRVKIYGIERDYTQSDPTWTRTDAAVGKTATVSVGSTAGHSDFDDCYPWSEMKRATLSTGDVMVKIPEFYYQRTRTGNIERIKIADKPVAGFKKHPGSGCYVSAYFVDNYYISKTNSAAKSYSFDDENKIVEKGAGWGLMRYEEFSALAFLTLVEFATNAMSSVWTLEGSMTGVTGQCDVIPNLTGMNARKTFSVYRGIEGWMSRKGLGVLLQTEIDQSNAAFKVDGVTFRVKPNRRRDYVKDISYIEGHEWITIPTELGATAYSYYTSESSIYVLSGSRSSSVVCVGSPRYGLFGMFTAPSGSIYTVYRG